jgi:hypothetical protein
VEAAANPRLPGHAGQTDVIVVVANAKTFKRRGKLFLHLRGFSKGSFISVACAAN